ncbi:hypothetical protein LDL08_40980 [Nonomuraea glycinis]|uniref:WD40 repeat domain-containing protein n=1 Tax=Nonomuraea glycinis TaxID=2047744 RepID=A0A918E9L1_9ACTN|nr:hypothetical protein [Nonomuraea glycinis]MCA2182555.1 hypothetical protein [Nonomuraea glycinis]GGP16980.1 hypothetical protein GCM10012278_82950 [Nonomuraea glycinis]
MTADPWPIVETHIPIPDILITLHERPNDPFLVTAVNLYKGEEPLRLLRGADDRFAKKPEYNDVVASPTDGKVVAIPKDFSHGYDGMIFLNRAYVETVRIRTVRDSMETVAPYWSRDGRRVVATIVAGGRPTGFVIVDALLRTTRVVTVAGMSKDARLRWAPGGRSLVASHQDGVRFFDLDGRVLRTISGVGVLAGGEDAFSPSGKRFVTQCSSTVEENICVWDARTGRSISRVPTKAEETLGWWDEEHLLCVMADSGEYIVTLMNFSGHIGRVVADVSASAWKKDLYLSYTRRARVT